MRGWILALAAGFALANATWAEDIKLDYNGRAVILHDDFTWEYGGDAAALEKLVVEKGQNLGKVLKSKILSYKVNYNDKEWSTADLGSEDAEFEFKHKSNVIFAVVILEKDVFELDDLQLLALTNAESLDPDAKLVEAVDCSINGIDGRLLTYYAKVENYNLQYLSFITSSEKGTIQYISWTLKSNFARARPMMLEMIAGLEKR